MQYPFEMIWKSIRLLRKPDVFSEESGKRWCEEAWTHITDANLLDIHSPIDITRARLCGFTLWWLAHDFCAACFGEDSSPELEWNEWFEKFEISPLSALVVGTESQPCNEALSNALVCQTEELSIYDGEFDFSFDESESDLASRVCALAAMRLRHRVVDAIVSGFGDESLLFASLYVATRDLDRIVERQMDELTEEAEEIEDKLQDESDPEIIRKLTSRLEDIKQENKPENLNQLARDKAINEALNGPISFGDEDSCSRMNGVDWCREGCRVVITGVPSVQRE